MPSELTLNEGEIVAVKWTNEDLKTPEGNDFNYSVRNEDVLYIRGVREDGLICELREDVFSRNEGRDFQYGLFVVPHSRLDTKESIEKTRKLVADFDEKYLKGEMK